MRLAESAGLHELLGERLSVPLANAGAKAACLVAGMLTGADSIDDLDVLRHGGRSKVLTGYGRRRRWARPCGASPSDREGDVGESGRGDRRRQVGAAG